MKLRGIFIIKSYSKKGELLNTIKEKNIVVNDGFNCLSQFINGGSATAFSDISLGTGTSTDGPQETDASLFSWYADETASVDWTYPNIAKWSAIFNFTETVTITEMAITKDIHTTLFNHILLSTPIEYHNGQFMIIDYQLEFTNE